MIRRTTVSAEANDLAVLEREARARKPSLSRVLVRSYTRQLRWRDLGLNPSLRHLRARRNADCRGDGRERRSPARRLRGLDPLAGL